MPWTSRVVSRSRRRATRDEGCAVNRRRLFVLAGALALVASTAGLAAATARAPALAVHPGPPLLWWPRAAAPQLENTGVWRAPPILVSGATAYRDGEWLYQDFLYDDHGARLQPDPADRRGNNQFSAPNGTYTYPSDRRYAENAADLVEFRIKPEPRYTAMRFTLNTMHDPTLIGISVAIGGRPGVTHPFPFGANVVAPADLFLTVHPSAGRMVATLTNTRGRSVGRVGPHVHVDRRRRQIEVDVADGDWNPGQSTVRLATGVGLWDNRAHRYLLPAASSSPTTPGGAGDAHEPAALFNVAFRTHEPQMTFGVRGVEQTLNDPVWWRDQQQAHALAAGDISTLYADVDFHKLRRRVSDDSGVPKTGSIDRILPSHFEPAQGVDYGSSCYSRDFRCEYQGRLQPYNIYVPARPPARTGYGMTLLLHANAANYNEFAGSTNQREFADRGTGSITLTTEARDPGGSYTGYAAADVFEAWAELRRQYHLDPSWQVISGYSLGGLGVYKLSEQWPDLFARAVAIVGTPGTPVAAVPQSAELASLRNIPLMIWDVVPADELNPYSQANAAAMQRLGYRYTYLAFPGDHLTPAFNDQFAPAAAFLGTARVQPSPAHITYVYAPSALDGLFRPYGDYPRIGLSAGHAYWLTGVHVRTRAASCNANAAPGCGGMGTVDALSRGFGLSDPAADGPQLGVGVLPPGALFPAEPYTIVKQTWADAPKAARHDAIHLTLTNISEVTILTSRAHVDCNASVQVSTDGPVVVHLAGCDRDVHAG